jgi:UDP-galactopyranose mutase
MFTAAPSSRWTSARTAHRPETRVPGRRPILIVGAGFAGATYARVLAEAGWDIHVIDRRPHIGGNAYDEVAPSGVRIHRYGPHLFHTANAAVVDWLSRFTRFVPYQHKVRARLPDGRTVPLPVNRQTINTVFGLALDTPDRIAAFLRSQAAAIPAPANAAEHLNASIGPVLTDTFFRPYTRKMWARELEDMDAAVVRRVALRHDDEDRYFPTDPFQVMPEHGYTALFTAILDHPRITVSTGTAFTPAMRAGHAHCFNSMPIDEYFDTRFGPLPYRSLRFHHREVPRETPTEAAVVNFTDTGPYTRETDWTWLPNHIARPGPAKTLTIEEPCAPEDNAMERYYPVKTSDGSAEALLARYRDLAAADDAMTFIGRCGTFQYLDMDQVINQSLMGARRWLAARPMRHPAGR